MIDLNAYQRYIVSNYYPAKSWIFNFIVNNSIKN